MNLLIIRYEYVYGINPFTNQNSKIMQTLIKRYPVVFPDTNIPAPSEIISMGTMRQGGYSQAMPHEFHDLIRDLLSKDPSERLGSEEFIEELSNHSFFKVY